MDTGEIAKQQLAQTLKKVVLLVEDHFDTRWATATYLRDGGLRVIEAIDSAEAKALAQVTGHIDLVFTDIYMPGPDDGYELSRWLATHYPKLPVLLTSGERENRSAHPKNSLREFVRKPYDLDRILETIRQMVGN